ncbi:hypothetical protein B0G74_8997 [Paraburkholderia sp. BL9I2N2]|nr:hypothetical protein B0G74_8997 [Paraburkholderia sp. BL9I2N2]
MPASTNRCARHPPPSGRTCGRTMALSVRCRTGQLRVATLWQLLRPYASRLIRTRARSNRKAGFEELSFIVAGMPDETLPSMVDYLAAQSWVLDAWFVP